MNIIELYPIDTHGITNNIYGGATIVLWEFPYPLKF